MLLPLLLQNLINETLKNLWEDPEHKIKPIQRLALYNAFGPLNHPVSNFAYAWLGLLTAKNVLNLWDKKKLPDDMPKTWKNLPFRLLDLSEEVLNGKKDSKILLKEAEAAYNIIGSEEYPYQMDFIALSALTATILDRNREPFKNNHLQENDTDDSLNERGVDVACDAIKAFAGIYDEDGLWLEISDPLKNLEFWEWWLTQAIPQAWELAQKSIKE